MSYFGSERLDMLPHPTSRGEDFTSTTQSALGTPMGSKETSKHATPLLVPTATPPDGTDDKESLSEQEEAEQLRRAREGREPGSPVAWPVDKGAATWPGIAP